jgi:Tfp pilus assembly protein PilF
VLKSLLAQASLSLRNGNATGAATILKKAIYLHPRAYEPHYRLGMLYARAGQLTLAIESLQKSVAITDKNLEITFDEYTSFPYYFVFHSAAVGHVMIIIKIKI